METAGSPSDAAKDRMLDWLGELGPRWGLPADACRVHGCLYLAARPISSAELSHALALPDAATGRALAWLEEAGLADAVEPDVWSTQSDPWELVTTALEHRRARELGPALDVLRASRKDASGDPHLARQIGRLLDLVEDIAAIDTQARRLSPAVLRGLLGAGGNVARLIGAVTGRRP